VVKLSNEKYLEEGEIIVGVFGEEDKLDVAVYVRTVAVRTTVLAVHCLRVLIVLDTVFRTATNCPTHTNKQQQSSSSSSYNGRIVSVSVCLSVCLSSLSGAFCRARTRPLTTPVGLHADMEIGQWVMGHSQ